MLVVAEFSTILLSTAVSMTSEERYYLNPLDVVRYIVAEWIIRAKDVIVLQIEFSRCPIEIFGIHRSIFLVFIPEK